MMKRFRALVLLFVLVFQTSVHACDGMSASVLSNVNLGNNQYRLTIQFCEAVSNGLGSAITGIILQTSGAGIITGTTTPSFTSNSTGVTINYNQINSNTVQWGEWDDNPDVPTFLDFGHPKQCFTLVIETNGPVSSVSIAGSSAPVSVGGGFVVWFGRYCCKKTLTVPPAVCNSSLIPSFTQLGPYCQNDSPGNLPTTSTNNITGTWAPSTISTSSVGSTTYFFTPNSGQCATTISMNISVNAQATPEFTQLGPYCQNTSPDILPTASTNSISGTWNPANINTSSVGSTTYTFMPNAGQCAKSKTMNITVNTSINPTFALLGPYCQNASPANLSTTSTNNISGTWNPSTISTGTAGSTSYIFTPNAGQCALTRTMNVTVNALTTPTFTPFGPYCLNASPGNLLTTSTNSIAGTWNPSTIQTSNLGSTTYTFTPNTGQCATTTTMNITVNALTIPTFTQLGPYCQNSNPGNLPSLSANSITGSWNPSAINTSNLGTTTYTFTPNTGQCATITTMNITVSALTTPTFTQLGPYCQYSSPGNWPSSSINGISGTWNPSIINTSNPGSTIYTFTPNTGQCATIASMNITVNALMTPTFIQLGPYCQNSSAGNLPSTSTNGITGTWNPSTINTSNAGSTVYTFIPNPSVCAATTTISVLVNPVPVILVNDVSVCNNQSVSISATGASTYQWSPPSGLSSTSGSTVIFSSSQTTSYIVKGTSADGCTSEDQLTVTVHPLPAINAGLDKVVCEGVNVTLSATGGVSYAWSNGVNNGVPFLPAVGSTTYVVTGVDNKGCTNTDELIVKVHAKPDIYAGNDVSVCSGQGVTLTASGGDTYIWDSGIQNGVIFYPEVGSKQYAVTGTNSFGCSDKDQLSVTVYPLPVINAGLDQVVCEGTNVTLSATGGVSYTWSNGVSNEVPFLPAVGSTTYVVTGVDSKGCTKTDELKITVHPKPDIYAGNDVSVCSGQGVTLTASGGDTYSWDNGIQNGIMFYPEVGSEQYSVTGTNLEGCEESDTLIVSVYPKPEVSFSHGKNISCGPFETTLTNTTEDAKQCIWTLSSGLVVEWCGTVPVSFTGSGCYDVSLTVTDSNNCVSISTSDDLICIEQPEAQFSSSKNTMTSYDTDVSFYNESRDAVNYEWNFGMNNEINTQENPHVLFPTDEIGDYLVTLVAISPAGCTDTAYSVVSIVDELIYYIPNSFTPDNEKGYNQIFKPVFTKGINPQEYKLYIFNRWGELIFESRNLDVGWDGSYGTWTESKNQIDICPDGTYTWKIEFVVSNDQLRRTITGHVNLIR